MWSTFFLHEADGRPIPPGVGVGPGAGPLGLTGVMGGRGAGAGAMGVKRRAKASTSGRPGGMSEVQEGKIKLAFFVAIVGVVLTVLGLGTEYWVELSPPKNFYNNQTCLAAHYGLWKGCTQTLWVADIDPERESCGPAELPGESNCTYFKFYTTGENAVIFQKTTENSLNVAAAMMALFGLFLMVMGAICITTALSKGESFFLKPASVCFILSASAFISVTSDPISTGQSRSPVKRIWLYVQPASQPQTMCNHASPGPPHPASSPVGSSETSHPDS